MNLVKFVLPLLGHLVGVPAPALAFVRVMPLLQQLTGIVATVETSGTTGPEKMAAAEKAVEDVLDAFPEFSDKLADKDRRNRILTKLVDLLNEFVH